ncbi:MAG: hypothetical protein NDJ94_17455 [Vicinamibacteria bacterium]|nr:hypothetical protein [Vicinamibacteria bacterium]
MAFRFTVGRVIPSGLIFLALFAAAIAVDGLLHLLGLVRVGRYLGVVGTLFILASFLYSLRKRRILERGSPKRLLQSHELLAWLGASMVLVHGGIHLNAFVPWLALVAMMVVVASGLTGKYLLQEARESLRERGEELRASGLQPVDVERELLRLSLMVDAMKKWRSVHMPLTMVFAGLAGIHLLATLLLWRW